MALSGPYASFWREDLGRAGDVTTRLTLERPRQRVRAVMITRQPAVASGLAHARAVFRQRRVSVSDVEKDGNAVAKGATLMTLRGPAEGVLATERLALNIVGRMSGIATLTARLQRSVARINASCVVAGTRKTTPGFRAFEKEAIAHGGGDPHRMGLFDAILIKDNHRALWRDEDRALGRAKAGARGRTVQVEVTTVAQAEAAARAAVDWILIDNRPPAAARRIATAARAIDPALRIEVSGGIDGRTVSRYASFADRISLGMLTHSAPAIDVSLDVVPNP